jgi:hypothetical protein
MAHNDRSLCCRNRQDNGLSNHHASKDPNSGRFPSLWRFPRLLHQLSLQLEALKYEEIQATKDTGKPGISHKLLQVISSEKMFLDCPTHPSYQKSLQTPLA